MDLSFSETDQAFRQEVRTWLQDNLPAAIQQRGKQTPSYVSKEQTREWQKILYAKGWIAPAWPAEYGGTGWSVTERFIFEEEYQRAHCPRISPFGFNMVGPVIYTFGTAAQKSTYLPRILASEDFWCQGYSEPGSGSDLASLSTRADRDGEEYRVNGHKIWTSGAHHADMMFCLVRTDQKAKPQAGISFLLIDMTTPGITVKPIVSIDGNHYLNEVFLDDVRVPVANRIGEEGKGWTYAKFLLGHERTGIAGVSKSRQKIAMLREIAAEQGDQGGRLGDNLDFRKQLGTIEVRLDALSITNLRNMVKESEGGGPGPEASTLKITGTEIEQDLNEMLVHAMGYYATPYHGDWLRDDWNETPVGPKAATGLMAEHLLRRAASIYGGSNEIQKNIIAKMILAL